MRDLIKICYAGALAQNMDTDALFEKYTIEEIREIEKKTRQDIERKKEDLRQMVGERYRDLIEAADTITEMKTYAQKVSDSVARMQKLCSGLQSFKSRTLDIRTRKITQKETKEDQFYSVAAQIKLLLDMPEKIWRALEGSEFLEASQLFLLARHINSSLHNDTQLASRINTYFPVLARQWSAIGHFQATIMQTCRERLQDVGISDQVASECLCSILLLESSTPVQVFTDFLAARMNALKQLFAADQSDHSIKRQVTDVVRMIVTTVRQIYTIFSSDTDHADSDNHELLWRGLKSVAERKNESLVQGKAAPLTPVYRHLPKAITDLHPVQLGNIEPISPELVRESSRQWTEKCVVEVKAGLGQLLQFISSVKGLAAIRDEVYMLLSEDEYMSSWERICQHVLQAKLPIWEEFLQDLFVRRAEMLLQGHLNVTSSAVTQQISRVLSDLGRESEGRDSRMSVERNLSSYVWTEGPSDIAPNTAWIPVSAKTLSESGALMMKSRAYTPALQGLCRILDNKLRTVLEDSRHYTQSSPDEQQVSHFTSPPGGSSVKDEPFDRYADREALQDFIKTACQQCVNKILDHMRSELNASKEELRSKDSITSKRLIIDRVLLLGRFTMAVCELSPHLQQCMSRSVPTDKSESRLSRKPHLIKKHSRSAVDDPSWLELKSLLDQFSHDAFSLWSDHTSQFLVDQFRSIVNDARGRAVLLASTRWDEIEIEEETDEGSKVKSTIRIPMQASWFVQSLLYNLCEEINRIGGHALTRRSLQSLVDNLSEGIVTSYQGILSTAASSQGVPLTQNRALQLLFDFRFITGVLSRKDDGQSSDYQQRCSEVTEGLESRIDPFDLDVFAPFLNSHLARQTQRCNVLHGVLISPSKLGMHALSARTAGSQQEQHNVLPLSTTHTRLPLLPLSVQQNRSNSSTQPVVLPPKPKVSSLLGTPAAPTSPPPTLTSSASSSFLGQMSTIWFSNVSK